MQEHNFILSNITIHIHVNSPLKTEFTHTSNEKLGVGLGRNEATSHNIGKSTAGQFSALPNDCYTCSRWSSQPHQSFKAPPTCGSERSGYQKPLK